MLKVYIRINLNLKFYEKSYRLKHYSIINAEIKEDTKLKEIRINNDNSKGERIIKLNNLT